jgi:hypothetical protein
VGTRLKTRYERLLGVGGTARIPIVVMGDSDGASMDLRVGLGVFLFFGDFAGGSARGSRLWRRHGCGSILWSVDDVQL